MQLAVCCKDDHSFSYSSADIWPKHQGRNTGPFYKCAWSSSADEQRTAVGESSSTDIGWVQISSDVNILQLNLLIDICELIP